RRRDIEGLGRYTCQGSLRFRGFFYDAVCHGLTSCVPSAKTSTAKLGNKARLIGRKGTPVWTIRQ
ncbi:MAG: hypothetical protein IIW69_07880, partial [Bacteroidaceae bacterium]|nr:hypothetical protein [Bacteroidaceae bacterium]